uniref:Uncharacterized protein n=1 Tax=Romanomermis culicivorax TaxID=13658 RepID=A0A915JWE5_ROMCU
MDSRSPLFNKVAAFSNRMFQPMMNMFNNWDSGMHRMMHGG